MDRWIANPIFIQALPTNNSNTTRSEKANVDSITMVFDLNYSRWKNGEIVHQKTALRWKRRKVITTCTENGTFLSLPDVFEKNLKIVALKIMGYTRVVIWKH